MPLIDIRAHGGGFGGGKYRKNSYIRYTNLDGVVSPIVSTIVTLSSITSAAWIKANDGYLYGIDMTNRRVIKVDPNTGTVVSMTNFNRSIYQVMCLADKSGWAIINSTGYRMFVLNLDGTIRWEQTESIGGTIISTLSQKQNGDIIYTKDNQLRIYDANTGAEKKRFAFPVSVDLNNTFWGITPDENWFMAGNNAQAGRFYLFNLNDGLTWKLIYLNPNIGQASTFFGNGVKNVRVGNIQYFSYGWDANYLVAYDLTQIQNAAHNSTVNALYKFYCGGQYVNGSEYIPKENAIVTNVSGALTAVKPDLSGTLFTLGDFGGSVRFTEGQNYCLNGYNIVVPMIGFLKRSNIYFKIKG
ncbi:SMP-30/gluconolactonase/LRE family protein [Thermaerobacillus caldiproteolyticus]|uniref:Uncharacterized protein n=1 Tax=Thermaerobacillus caldiproteolyticus TaxID=247480 RepID=A0A7W0BZB5_9BACL|nr:hypothetical protein [Anoxybacillus caldiproteolyticus]MBA2874301.1 hypothetical protein [Anoxybacillus caldiproteolyticus]